MMLQIHVTLWGRWFVCVCVRVYLELLSHFLPIKINLTNISPILIKIVDFKNLAWARLVFPLGQVENSSTCPTGQVGKKLLYPDVSCLSSMGYRVL